MTDQPVSIITGASRGIGRAAAELLAARGQCVVVSSRNQKSCDAVAESIIAHGGAAEAIACHIGHEEQIGALVKETMRRRGRIDGVVMNAASNPVYGPSQNVDEKAFNVIMRNNVYSALRLAHFARPHLVRSPDPAIVLVSSIAGALGNRMIGAYGMSKAGENQLARNLALEFGADGIRVNAVAPGLVRTGFSKALLEDEHIAGHFERTTPLGRVGEPEDIAGVIAFLLSADARWITGQVITADGGISVTGGF